MTTYTLALRFSIPKLQPETVMRRADAANVEACTERLVRDLFAATGTTVETITNQTEASTICIR
jgi:hypothetical protein